MGVTGSRTEWGLRVTPCKECEGPLGANYYEFDEGAICDDCLEEFLTDSRRAPDWFIELWREYIHENFWKCGVEL